MPTAELELRYRPDDSDRYLGQLYAKAVSGRFSGEGEVWIGQDKVEAFIAALRMYPLSATALPMLEGGFWNKDNSSTLEQRHLYLAVRPYDGRGTLLVHVEFATESEATPDKDQQQTATIRFTTEYAALPDFTRELELVLDGSRQTATLVGKSRETRWP